MFTERTYKCVGYRELEQFIKDTQGLDYSVPLAMDATNDTYLTVHVTGEVDKYEQEDLDDWKANPGDPAYYPGLWAVLNHLCYCGLVPSGDYLIEVSW